MTTTKLELQQTNARLATECAALRAQVAQLQGDLSMAKDALTKATHDITHITSCASAVNKMTQPQWQKDRALAMALARDMAMGARIVVKV